MDESNPLPRNLRALREDHDMTQNELAAALDVTQTTVAGWENRNVQPRRKMLDAICQLFGIGIDDLTSFANGYYAKANGLTTAPDGALAPSEPRKAYAPLYGRVHAGTAQEPEVLSDRVPIPFEVFGHHPHGYFLEVEGDCMDEVYPDGCLVYIDPDLQPRDGSIAVVSIDDEDYIMRRLKLGTDTLLLSPESHNPRWHDLVVTSDSGRTVSMVGTVVWYQSAEEME